MIKITKRQYIPTDYMVEISAWTPCCLDWAEQFGDSLQALPDFSGVVPSGVTCLSVCKGKLLASRLSKKFRFCPFCGKPIVVIKEEVSIQEAKIG